MKQKKLLLFALVLSGVFVLLSFDNFSATHSPTGDQNTYEQAPPIASRIWIRKLEKPMEDGSTMLFQAQFDKGFIKGNTLTIYPSQEAKVTLFDDGKNGGDAVAGDNIFSGFFKEDVDKFEKNTLQMEETLRKQGQFIEFNGRVGNVITKIPHFDAASFDKFQLIDLNPQFMLATDCGTGLLKQNSLLITDLSVVEDPARTYNICSNTGNAWGAWTFGTLAKSIAFESSTGVSAKTLIAAWLTNWTTNRIVAGQNILNSHTGLSGIPATTNLRENEMLNQIITPWLRNAYANPSLVVTLTTWRSLWDGAAQDQILKFAPFKLTAIVNRLDLRGNHSYASSITNAGETRFIFSAINANVGTGACGTPIANGVRQGFNVIFEFGNPQTNCSALKNFAQQWLDLSDDALGTTTFNDHLELITKQITDSGNGGASKPNSSCINRIRTNEIALSQGFNINLNTPPTVIAENRWQLLEFELNSTTHLFEGVGVKVTPRGHANGGDPELANLTQFNTTTASKFNFVDSISKWVNGHQTAVQNGNIVYPTFFPNSTTKNILGASSEIISLSPGQTDHFWDGFNPFVSYDASLNVVPSTSINSDLARQQFSINTCAGCHGGEARTVFTQIRYLGYGQPAIYWTANPSFSAFTGRKVDNVSPFLTGRKRTDGLFPDVSNSPSGLFSDDNTNPSETPNDDALNGLFYVNDIAGRTDGSGNPLLWGLNDLERRKQDMCHFLVSSCSPFSTTFALVEAVRFSPLPIGSH